MKKCSFLEKLETIWWVSLKPSRVSIFFREILRILRNFGGFIAKMRSKITKMRVLRLIIVPFYNFTVLLRGGLRPTISSENCSVYLFILLPFYLGIQIQVSRFTLIFNYFTFLPGSALGSKFSPRDGSFYLFTILALLTWGCFEV